MCGSLSGSTAGAWVGSTAGVSVGSLLVPGFGSEGVGAGGFSLEGAGASPSACSILSVALLVSPACVAAATSCPQGCRSLASPGCLGFHHLQ